jgi:TolA-binding protein
VKNGDLSAAAIDFEKAWRMGFDKNVTETALYNYVAARMDGGDVPFSSSVDILETFLNSYPNSQYAPSVREYLAAAYFEEKDYSKALASINKIKNPSSKALDAKQKVLYELGVEAVSNGKNADAVNYLKQAISMSSRNANIANQSRLWLGEALYSEGDFKNAASTLETYLKTDKNSSNRGLALYNLAYSLYMQDKFQEAGTYFSQARKSTSLSQTLKNDALLREADCLYYRKDYSGALSLYRQAESSEGSDAAYAAMRSAVMEGLKGDKDKKISSLQTMIKNYPDSKWVPTAHMELASTYESLGKTSDAQREYKGVFENYPTTTEARQAALKLGVSYASNGDTNSGINTLKQVIEKWPSSDEAQTANTELKRLMGAENRLNEYVEFLSAIPGAPKIDTNEVEQLMFESAETAWAEDSSSIKQLENYVSTYPDGRYLARALSDLSISYEEAGKYEKALTAIDELVSKRSDAAQVPEALLLKATIIEEHYPARKSEALAAYRGIVDRDYADKMPEVYVGIMRLSDSPTEIVNISSKIEDGKGLTATQLEEATYYKATALEKLNRGSEAEALYKQLATNVKSLNGAKGAVALGEYYISTKQYDKALTSMKQFIDEGTPHNYWLARGYITLADAYYAKGKKSTAREYMVSLRENYPGTESDIKEMITERINTWK